MHLNATSVTTNSGSAAGLGLATLVLCTTVLRCWLLLLAVCFCERHKPDLTRKAGRGSTEAEALEGIHLHPQVPMVPASAPPPRHASRHTALKTNKYIYIYICIYIILYKVYHTIFYPYTNLYVHIYMCAKNDRPPPGAARKGARCPRSWPCRR